MEGLGAALDVQLSRRRQNAAQRPAGNNLELGLRMSVELMDAQPSLLLDEPPPSFSFADLWRRAQDPDDAPQTQSP